MEDLLDPKVSSVFIELENEEKDSEYLIEKLQISLSELRSRLSYVMECGFIIVYQKNEKEFFKANFEKLDKIMENANDFSGVVDGLTELDQYLN